MHFSISNERIERLKFIYFNSYIRIAIMMRIVIMLGPGIYT